MSMNVATLAHNTALRLRLLEVQSEMNLTQMQVSTGKKSDVFSGLRSETRTSISLSVTQSTTQIYKQNINIAKTRTDTMQTVLKRINDIAVEIKNAAIEASSVPVTATGSSTVVVKTAGAGTSARNRLPLNTEVDGRYLFSGFDISNPPMIDPGAIGTVGTPLDDVAALAAGADHRGLGHDALCRHHRPISAPSPTTTPVTPVATNQATVRIDDGTDINYGVRGDDASIQTVLRGIYAMATTDLTTTSEARLPADPDPGDGRPRRRPGAGDAGFGGAGRQAGDDGRGVRAAQQLPGDAGLAALGCRGCRRGRKPQPHDSAADQISKRRIDCSRRPRI